MNYYIARGSVAETESHIEYARRVGYIHREAADTVTTQLRQLMHDLNKIIVTLKP